MGGRGNAVKDKIELKIIADMLVYKITEMVRGKKIEHGSITFTFSPASDTINYRVEISKRIPIKDLTIK
jgi:hypothetical protein